EQRQRPGAGGSFMKVITGFVGLLGILLSWVVLGSTSAGLPDKVPASDAVLRVGTWNIEWLGRAEERHSKEAQKAEDLAKYIAETGVDVLALNEVAGDEGTDENPRNKTLSEVEKELRKSSGQEWLHLLFPKEDPKEKHQLTGVLWNTAK